jgi:hypothetical protein
VPSLTAPLGRKTLLCQPALFHIAKVVVFALARPKSNNSTSEGRGKKAVFVKLRHFRVSNINLEKNYLYLK